MFTFHIIIFCFLYNESTHFRPILVGTHFGVTRNYYNYTYPIQWSGINWFGEQTENGGEIARFSHFDKTVQNIMRGVGLLRTLFKKIANTFNRLFLYGGLEEKSHNEPNNSYFLIIDSYFPFISCWYKYTSDNCYYLYKCFHNHFSTTDCNPFSLHVSNRRSKACQWTHPPCPKESRWGDKAWLYIEDFIHR